MKQTIKLIHLNIKYLCVTRCGTTYCILGLQSTASLYGCFALLLYHTEMQTLELPSDKRCTQMILHSALLLAFGEQNRAQLGYLYTWNLQMIKWGTKKGKRLHFSMHNMEQLCSCSQIAPTSSVMGEEGSEDTKSLLTPVLGWAQAGQQIRSNVVMSNTEYNNTQWFLPETSEETPNSTASFAKCYCWSTCFWVAITDFTKLFVKGDKFSILVYRNRNSHCVDTC